MNEYCFPEVPQEALEDIKDDFADFSEGEQSNTHMELPSSEELQSCEEITENIPIEDAVDICANLDESFTSSINEEVCSPSAPCGGVEQNYVTEDVYSKPNKISYPDLISQISLNVTQHRNSVEKLKPFTEIEMSAHYYNQELHNYDAFVNNFVEMELKSGNVVRQPLHELLMEYLTCRDNLCKNGLEFDSLVERYKEYQEKIWNSDTSSYTEYGECQV